MFFSVLLSRESYYFREVSNHYYAGNTLFEQIWLNNKNSLFKTNFSAKTNIESPDFDGFDGDIGFFLFNGKHLFRTNLIQKIKTVRLR